jgi:hypothetical protein
MITKKRITSPTSYAEFVQDLITSETALHCDFRHPRARAVKTLSQ